MNNLNTEFLFPCPVYHIEKTEFLEAVSLVANESLDEIKKSQSTPDEIYPVFQTGSLFDDRINNFLKYVSQTAWDILDSQGFNMSNLNTVFHEFWCQEHYKYSGMEEHIHGNGAQLIGFYFLETPENCSRVIFHDPKSAKKQINLQEKNSEDATIASCMINYIPKPGLLMFANSWLPHSFTRNSSDKPMKFIHFTIGIQYAQQKQPLDFSEVEII